jgi:hypothetical protein
MPGEQGATQAILTAVEKGIVLLTKAAEEGLEISRPGQDTDSAPMTINVSQLRELAHG